MSRLDYGSRLREVRREGPMEFLSAEQHNVIRLRLQSIAATATEAAGLMLSEERFEEYLNDIEDDIFHIKNNMGVDRSF